MRLLSLVALGAGLAAACTSCGAVATQTAATPVARRTPPPGRAASTRALTRARPAAVPRPPIHLRLIPLTPRRRAETVAYAERHYGLRTSTIAHPYVIVEHLTENGSVSATYSTFAPDVPDVELHELPGICSQFVIGRDGGIVQLTPMRFLCRHTVGLNWAAIGIEHVGYKESDVLGDPAQLRASLRLTRWLRCRFHIPVQDVIGHAESLGSPYRHERVAALRTQTHGDWQPWAMRRYRAMVRRLHC